MSMITATIEHKGKKFEIQEITIEMWASVMKLKDLLEEEEMYVRMISQVTGLSRDEVLECDAYTIQKVGDTIMNVINQESRQLFRQIEHKGVKYNLVDVTKISFGQFVDIDTYLKKDEAYRIANLNELAAYLYCEDKMDYGRTDFSLRIEEFKDLPIKYIDGALFFLLNLAKGSEEIIKLYSQSKLMWKILKVRILLMLIGDGITVSARSVKRKYGSLTMLLLYPFISALIIFRTCLTSTKKKKD